MYWDTFVTSIAFVKNITQHRSLLRFPDDEDLKGAAVALMRLQDTYKLDTHALAEGKLLGGKKYSRHLTGMHVCMSVKEFPLTQFLLTDMF